MNNNNAASALASKKTHYDNLHAQLLQLNDNIVRLNSNINVTAKQMPTLSNMGVIQTAMSMSATRVLNDATIMDKLQLPQEQERNQ